MTVFDDVLSRARALAKTAGEKTGEFVELTKVKMEIADLEREMTSLYEGLGRLVYDGKQSGENVDELVDACIAQLDDQNEHLKELQEKLMESKNVVACKMCGALNENDAVFCNQCGEKL